MAAPVAGPSSTQQQHQVPPPATANLLQSLAPVHSAYFPRNRTRTRPDTDAADTPELKEDAKNKVALLKSVLGTYFSDVEMDLFNSSKELANTSEKLLAFASVLPGSLEGLSDKPRWLLFTSKPSNAPRTLQTPQFVNGSPVEPTNVPESPANGPDAGNPEEDFATWFSWQTLRLGSALEYTLLGLNSMEEAKERDKWLREQVQQERKSLQNELEATIVGILEVLLKSAVRLTSRGGQKSDPTKDGGVAKAREIVEEMLRIVQAITPTSRESTSNYPRRIPIFESSRAYQPHARSPTKTPHLDSFSPMIASPSLELKSSSHARSLVLVTLRILLQATATSLFLAEYRPIVVDLLLSTWPSPSSFRVPESPHVSTRKAKEREVLHGVSEVHEIFTREWLELVEIASTQSVGGFKDKEAQMIAQRVLEVMEARLLDVAMEMDDQAMEIDDHREDPRNLLHERIDRLILNLMIRISPLQTSTSNAAHSELRQLFGRFVANEAPCLVQVLFDDARPLPIRASSLLILTSPLSYASTPAPDPFLALDSSSSSTSPLDLLSIASLRQLDQHLQKHTECPFDLASLPSPSLLRSAFNLLQRDFECRTSIRTERNAAIEAQTSNTTEVARKRRTMGAPASDGPTGNEEIPGSTAKRRKKLQGQAKDVAAELLESMVKRAVRRGDGGLKQVLEQGEKFEPFDSKISRLISAIPDAPEPSAIDCLRTLGLVGCARSDALPRATVPDESPSHLCTCCDAIGENSGPRLSEHRILTTQPWETFERIASNLFDPKQVGDKVRLTALITLQRVIRHTLLDALRGLELGGALLSAVFNEMEANSKSVRTAAGHVLLAVVAAEQERGFSTFFIRDLFQRIDRVMNRSAQITETTLRLVGRLAKLAEPTSLLECECLARVVRYLGNGNVFLKSAAKLQLAQTAQHRGIAPYKLVKPHWASLGPVIVSSKVMIESTFECLHSSMAALHQITKDYTIPELMLSDKAHRDAVLGVITKELNQTVAEMFMDEGELLSNTIAKLYMEEDEARDRAVKALEAETASTIAELITVKRVPIIFTLALEFGNEDETVRAKAERALLNVERTRLGSSTAKVEISEVLFSSIVGILNFMNARILETQRDRPLRDKQKIVRSLSAIALKVGAGISGYSPQIMATLQTALSFPGLRMTALEGFKSFMTTGKFSHVGVFLSPVSSTFVHLWPELTDSEKAIAGSILSYIVENRVGFKLFMQDVADLSHLPEVASTSAALSKLRSKWTFEDWTKHLLERIKSENDAVTIEALKELRNYMSGQSEKLHSLAFGDTFDPSIGKIVEGLLGAAVKDGPQYAEIRNVACECIGILGAVDPDRFETPPVQDPPVVLENFENHEESIRFALRLIQDLLVGAYRSTNDTTQQEFLAVAIQDLLKFCGFTPSTVGALAPESTANDDKQRTWSTLSPNVQQACTPLLGTQFIVHKLVLPAVKFPIYEAEEISNFRDWVRCFAIQLYRKTQVSRSGEGEATLQQKETCKIFKPFEGLLSLEDSAVPQYLLPHLVLNSIICGSDDDRSAIKKEMQLVLEDQVSSTHRLPENSRLLAAQTIFALMDHLSRWITLARKRVAELKASRKKGKTKTTLDATLSQALLFVEGILQDIPHILVGKAALTCKSYARSLLNFESHIIAQRAQRGNEVDKTLQDYYEDLHQCYADLDEPDGMEGISTKILSPTILHQIREHESTGRWTSAQSCWEVELQKKPDDAANHVGLLRCLRNLGHYDSMRTHIMGLLSSKSDQFDWERILAPFNIEASLFVGDWDAVEDTLNVMDLEGPEAAFGRVLCSMRAGDQAAVEKAFFEARAQLGGPIVAAGRESYRRVYDSVVNLHVLNELKTIHESRNAPAKLVQSLRDRLDCTSPSFRAREPILNLRRTAFRLAPASNHAAKNEIGELWLETSKIARKAGHSQTAYSAILQARDCDAEFAFYQSAKLLKAGGQTYKAIQELDNPLKSRLAHFNREDPDDALVVAGRKQVSPLAKAALRRARWMLEAGRVEQNAAVAFFKDAGALAAEWESPLYYLGHYWDQLADATPSSDSSQKAPPVLTLRNGVLRTEVVRMYAEALRYGTKYIYQALPRLLTIWLEMSETPGIVQYVKARAKDPKAAPPSDEIGDLYRYFVKLNERVTACAAKSGDKGLPTYQWLTVLPQLVSRILHPNERVVNTLEIILLKVLRSYPHHGFWAMASGAKSMTNRRSKRNSRVLQKAKDNYLAGHDSGSANVAVLIDQGLKLVQELLLLCDYNIAGKVDTMSLRKSFPNLYSLLPAQIIIPLQNSLTVSLPFDASQAVSHKPFPDNLPTFQSFEDQILIMSSLQKPRKITIRGSDGQLYSFLCKPKDDLRKDARLMEFNAMIIKLLKKDSEARSRKLNIRTYSVVPLNEECGLIEWVPHVVVLRGVLNKAYASRGIASWSPELKRIFDTIRDQPKKTGERFEKEVLSKFPPVFHDWFLENFPEPSAWHRARLAYSRTAAVISMVGFVLGLGDRHCENILLDGTTGDTVHVDFNCLFDKGRSFDVSEKVPFRLTANIIDGMGVTGIEGVFRRSAEIALKILRANKDSLRSVLETFLHDPLVEWISRKSSTAAAEHTKSKALESLEPISNKLRGLQVTSDPASLGAKEVTVEEQVERLIREARDPANLGGMYVGLHRSTNEKMCSDNAVAFLTGLPKCEHHMHIEGSLEPELLFNLAEKNQIALTSDMYSTIEALKTRYENFTSLDDFLAYFNAAMDVLLHEDDFAALAYAYMKRVSTDGLVHTEVFFDPQAHTGRGIALEVVVNGLTKGLNQGEKEFGISHKLIMCFVKHLSVDAAVEAVGQMSSYFASGQVCGLGADSTEKNNPPSKFASVYEKAREVNVPHLTMHSGEEGPADWVRETLALGINRVDHGVHAADDPELLKELASRKTLLTVCPLSNVRLRVHKDVKESPIPLLLEAGVPFSINSDDPSYFGGYILDNYLAVQKAFNFSKDVWRTIATNSVNGSWCSDERKKEITSLIDAHFEQWAEKDL